ncbi:uncharacterized protein LOC108891188 isoform X1 [Lates calcarifer]|uniref:Uncharacterized protein LOC108891026 n=1 Tax=Lates calcarifer TaxID=8187 RepID=A0AAJ8B1M6_LATCA|nr:uncharacterized protein LOC108891026 [Lates calcarifer]XP_050923633.1 uncharacterized protein LOC108891188 isoform X1 [Lates calcarifer]XP_050923634.1 uncharacterized protein LOC108891188 isoform X1 [Lates calcarifer]
MGKILSKEEELERFVKQFNEGPNMRVDQNIVKFCSLDSSENLKQHYEGRKMETGDHAADWIKNLAEKMAALMPAPELAGLGALAIAILIDVVSKSPPEKSTEDALRCVFAEEKASEVWDQIDECLKRCTVNFKNKVQLRTDIERIEYKLSEALTKLKNSMVRDGQMTSEALKAWINGAAFHIQMLIHLVRLGGIPDCDPVERLISTYKRDLDLLLKKHREMVEKKCKEECRFVHPQSPYIHYLVDEDSKWHRLPENSRYKDYFEAYYSRRYSSQKREIECYFNEVGENLQSLVRQSGSFNVQ